MAYDYFSACPHCWSDEIAYSTGCEKCGHTNERTQITLEDAKFFESMKEYFDRQVDASFDAWLTHIKEEKITHSIESYEVTPNTVYIKGSRYSRCNNYDYEDFQMPTKYILGANPVQAIKDEGAIIKAGKEAAAELDREKKRQQKILDDAEKTRLQNEFEKAEYLRLKNKFE